MNKNCIFDREKITKLILEEIIKEETRDNFSSFISKIVKTEPKDIIPKNKNPLSNFDIMSNIYKYVGSINLLNCILYVQEKIGKQKKIKKKLIKKRKKLVAQDILNKKRKREKEKLIEDEEEEEKVEIISSSESNGYFLSQFDRNSPNENEEKDENNSSKSSDKFISLGVNSEVKTFRKKNIIQNSVIDDFPEIKNGINSEKKCAKPFKEIQYKKNSDLSYHYKLDNNSLYKYKFVEINKNDNLAVFLCDDPECKGKAEYDLIHQIFMININHSIDNKDHSYIKNMSDKDYDILNYMKTNSFNDIQLKKINE